MRFDFAGRAESHTLTAQTTGKASYLAAVISIEAGTMILEMPS
jgi:hypothetical protein